MKSLKRRLKNKGMILPLTLFILTLIIWIFSIYLIFYKNEIDGIRDLKIYNDRFWRAENLTILAEYEIYEGDVMINLGEYKDIIEYFEGKEQVWLEKNKTTKSGYSVNRVKDGNGVINEVVEIHPYKKNEFYIELIKLKKIDNKEIVFKVNLLYRYPIGESDLKKYEERKLISFGVKEL